MKVVMDRDTIRMPYSALTTSRVYAFGGAPWAIPLPEAVQIV